MRRHPPLRGGLFVAVTATVFGLALWAVGSSGRSSNGEEAAGVGRTRLLLAPDWPMRGGTPQRNMVSLEARHVPICWDVKTGKNVKWVAELGSKSYGGPVV